MRPGEPRAARGVKSRLSLCYAAPGQSLLGTAGPTRNVLSVAQAMSQWADVTVAFRTIPESVAPSGFRITAIEDSGSLGTTTRDDVAVRGLNPFVHAAYLREVRRFAAQAARSYDVVFEKGWRFSGYLAREVMRQGTASGVIENDVRYWNEPIRDFRTLLKYAAQTASQFLAARCSRQVPLVIAETEELKEVLIALRGIAPDRIEVVQLGVDHGMFRPRDQSAARDVVRINQQATVLLYVGGLDIYHDLGPLIEALGREARDGVELHIAGDGELRSTYEQTARRLNVLATFHGQVAHERVSEFIAAADLCVAPYQPNKFYAGKITFSTLKIPEYMACARPVASVPNGHILRLIDDQVSGFLLANEVDAWVAFLRALPSRSRLQAMGWEAAKRAASLSWEKTAARYLELAQRLSMRR
jgi:glycosyltransferase involved in cell wall biosynthesis